MQQDNVNGQTALMGVLVLGVVLLLVGGIGYVILVEPVDEGERGVVKDKGAVTGEVWEPGWHVRQPFVEEAEHINVRPRTYTMSGNVHEGDVEEEDAIDFHSADEQHVGVDVTVRYRVRDDHVADFHSEWNNHGKFRSDLLRPETIDTVAREASAMNATEAKSQDGRGRLATIVTEALREEAPEAVVIEAVAVRDIHLAPDYQDALEQVEVAQQRAESERREAEGDADAERIRAQGDAEAMQIRDEQITEQILQHQQIQAYDEGTVYVVDPNSNTITEIQSDTSAQSDQQWGNSTNSSND